MPNILAELKELIEDKGLTMDNIKCCDVYLDHTFNPYMNNHDEYETVTTDFIINTYEDDKHREDTITRMSKHNYDAGFGGQELFGIVWMDNGEWITRGEYDGSEWWDYHRVPEIFTKLLNNNIKE